VSNIVVLNSQTHRDLRVSAVASARYGDGRHFVQVVVNEFPLLAARCPVFFAKDGETGAFYCGAMLGFEEGENLFLKAGGSFDGHRPLNLQRDPFYASGAELAIDLDSPRIGAPDGEALFTETGEPTAYLQSVMAAFRDLKPGIERTKVFVATLLELKLIEPVDINLGFDDGTTRDLVGLYTISQQALGALPDASVVDLFRRGYLYLIHLMIASMKQIPVMAEKKNRQLLEPSGGLVGALG
jgi:hypothetical protein